MKYAIIADLSVMPAFIYAEYDKKGVRNYDEFGVASKLSEECLYDKDEAEDFVASMEPDDDDNVVIPLHVVAEAEAKDRYDLMMVEAKLKE